MTQIAANGNASWNITFDYIESCNCHISCPCPFTGTPTSGYCHLIMAFNVLDGTYGDTRLTGLSAVMVNDVPGNMRAGGYRTAIYVDSRGDVAQRNAIELIFSGKAGGVWGGFASLTVQWLGIRHVPIEVSSRKATVRIPDVLDVTYEPMKGFGGKTSALIGTGQRIALGKRLNVGKSTVSRFNDYGISWDNTGCNVFWGRFSHSSTS